MTLDDLSVLSAAVQAYRAAATAAGIAWPDDTGPRHGAPPELVHRLFDVDHVADQLTWLQSQGWDEQRLFPDGGWLLPWPTDTRESLDNLSFAIGTPFPWRHQVTLFHFEIIVYTFVLAGDHEGEIWRYEAGPDAWDSVRAATSLAELFTQWTKGIAAGVLRYHDVTGWLFTGDGVHRPVDALLARSSELDPLAFPIPLSDYPLLRARQRECGVDLDCVERGFECQLELLDAIAAVRAALGS